MIAHTSLAVSNYSRSKAFYTKTLATLGYENNMEYGEAAGFNDGKNTDFWISEERDRRSFARGIRGEGSRTGPPRSTRRRLRRAARTTAGPGYRTEYWPGYYASFVYDPDGNNIEAVWYDHSKVK